jgi:DNA repair protein SbcC/Rad50
VRIAFAEEAEHAEKLPLVLDEAFSMSDNERWAEMVRSLYSLAAAGRQVLYFSANENEIESWCNLAEDQDLPQPVSLDLAAARRLEGHERQVTLIPRRAKQVPKVAELSPEEAMEVLQVPLPQPHRSVDEMHLLHLLNEDLGILDVCLEHKVATVGQWRSAYKRRRGAKLAGDHAKAARIDARTRIAERTVQAWHAGRNRPVGRAELEAAGVTPKWLDEVSGLLAEMGGDPGRLIEALRDKVIKGYQRPKIDKHEAWFQAEGFMDGDTILDEDEIAERAAAAAEKDIAAGRITDDEARLLSLEISGLLDEAAKALDEAVPA